MEHIQFNEETLWSSFPRDHNNPQAPEYLPKVRAAVFAGKYDEADRLVKQMQGPFTQSYLPFGDITLDFGPAGETEEAIQDYRRWLDLDTATHFTTFRRGEVRSPADGYACEVAVEILTESTPWPRNAGTDGLYRIWKQAADELGLAVGAEERGGLSDGNLIWNAVPTLDGLGPWGDNDHCSERSPDGAKLPEFVELSSFVPKAMLNVVALQKLCGA